MTLTINSNFISAEYLEKTLATDNSPIIIGIEVDKVLGEESLLPGAVSAQIKTIFAGKGGGDLGLLPLPKKEDVKDYLLSLGVASNTLIVVYDAGNSAHAARAWWIINWVGHHEVKILDGGLKAWKSRQSNTVHELTNELELSSKSSNFSAVTTADVEAHLADYFLIDARSASVYQGSGEGVHHLPGSINSPVVSWQDAEGKLLPFSERQLKAKNLGVIDTDKPVLAYCGAGVAAAYWIAATSDLGIDSIFYPGSWSAWSADSKRLISE